MQDLKRAKFNYKNICASLLKGMPDRGASVIERRFGIDEAEKKETLELIGQTYGITRERVRQIEKEGISKIKPKTENYAGLFSYFKQLIGNFGGVKKEEELVSFIGGGKNSNHISFLLALSEGLSNYPEDDNYYSFWAESDKTASMTKKVVDFSVKKFNEDKKPVSPEEFYQKYKSAFAKLAGKDLDRNSVDSYLGISKKIRKNPEGLIGLAGWVEINPKSIRDIAYLVFKKENKSLHFSKAAEMIQKSPYFSKEKIHVATVHNELIKDQRFVLVGRGLYALKEWGYEPGVVKDVIKKILKEENRPMSKREILDRVLKQRIVKANTVFLNLQNKNYFLRDSNGNYTI